MITQVAHIVAGWGFARLFAECVDKQHFDPVRAPFTVDEQAFEQVVSRLETFLQVTKSEEAPQNFGVSIHDTNQTVAKRDTELMQHFHQKGTFWTDVNNLIETPLFVDSELTSMQQIAALCSYALRRYLKNGEEYLSTTSSKELTGEMMLRLEFAISLRMIVNARSASHISQRNKSIIYE